MKHGRFIAVAVFCALFAPGCRNARDHKVLYREMRLLEDQIYALEDENSYLTAQLASARRENESLRDELGEGGDSPSRRRSRDSGGPRPPSVELPEVPSRERIEGPTPAPYAPGDDAPPFDPGTTEMIEPQASGAVEDPNVSAVTFHRLLTGGYDADGRPGDEGVSLVLEPRNPRGELVRTPGDIEIAVIDPERGDGRVAQWKFTASELAPFWERRTVGEGYFLELPWPNRAPDNRQLELIVNYRTPRGKRLIAEKRISVDLDGGNFAEWTSAETPARQSSAAPQRREKPSQAKRPGWSPRR